MVKNVKSIYFIQKLFSYLNEYQKLSIVKYNKIMQKNIKISITNYIHFKGYYIIHESNGITKEYNGYDDELIFEGEYLNGKRNGKGKEYYINGKFIFEGEYLNGKRNGRGKEYYLNGKLKDEIDYFNGIKSIEIGYRNKKIYQNNGSLKFEIEYLDGKRNGKGKEYYNNYNLKF